MSTPLPPPNRWWWVPNAVVAVLSLGLIVAGEYFHDPTLVAPGLVAFGGAVGHAAGQR